MLFLTAAAARPQKLAVIAPERGEQSSSFSERLAQDLAAAGEKVLDGSLSAAAFSSSATAGPFNLTTEQARNAGRAIGCEYYVLVRSETLRRSSFQRAEYYESFAAAFLVSTRTGRLAQWKLISYDAARRDEATQKLFDASDGLAREIRDAANAARRAELAVVDLPYFAEQPADGTPAAKTFRAPIPYRRLKPEYTKEAALYGITATVDAMVFLEDTGKVSRVEIDRWAGFGLDASVESNIRAMNWRPAELNGKPVAIKFLVRYNFKNVE